MNLKTILNQFDLLPEAEVNKHINSMLFPLRKPMILEAAKDEPNVNMIYTLKVLDDTLTESAPHRVHPINDTALFVFNAQQNETDEDKQKRALSRAMALVADGRAPRPRSKAELDKLVLLEMQRHDDEVAENFGKAIDATQFIDSLVEGEYDESELPEWVIEAVTNKIIDIALSVYKDAKRRLSKARFDFQKMGPNAAREGALALLRHFGIEVDEVDAAIDRSRLETQELFNKLMHEDIPVPTIEDDMPTPKEKKKRYAVKKEAA